MAGFSEGAFDIPPETAAPAPNSAASTEPTLGLPQSSTAAVLSPTANSTFGQAIAYGLPSVGLGLIDTLGTSLHVLKDDSVQNAVKAITGDSQDSMGDFYSRNRPQLRTAGEIAGFWLPGKWAMDGLKAVNGIREAGSLGSALKNSAAMDILLGNSADLAISEAKIGSEVSTAVADQGVWANKVVNTPAVVAAKRGYYAKRAVDAARTSIAFEMGTYAGFNSSETFYPQDTTITDQLKWAGAGVVAGGAIELAMARYAVRNLVQGAVKATRASGEAADSVLNLSPLQKDADKIIFRPAARGVGTTYFASLDQDLNNTQKISSNSAQLQTGLTQDRVNIKKVLSAQINAMAYDPHPVLPRVSLDQGQVDLGLEALGKNPNIFLYATKLGNLPDSQTEFYAGLGKKLEGAKTDYNTAAFAASVKNPVGSDAYAADIAKTNANLLPMEGAANEVHYVVEPDGRFSVYKNRAANWLDTNDFSDIKRKTYITPTTTGPVNSKMTNSKLIVKGSSADIILHDNFRAEIPKSSTPIDYSGLYAAGSKMINDWKPVEGQTFILTPQVNWRTTEMTLALADAKPEAKGLIQLGSGSTDPGATGFASVDDAQFHVLNEKFKEFQSLMPDTSRPPISAVKSGSLLQKLAGLKSNYTPAEVLQRLNLPEQTGFAPQPVIEMFAHAKLQGMKDLNEMFPMPKDSILPPDHNQMDLVQTHLRQIVGAADQTTQIPISGNLLKQTSDAAPLFVASKGAPLMARADAELIGRVNALRNVQLERLGNISPDQSPLVNGVIGKIVGQSKPVYRAGQDGTYAGIQEGGDLSGAANQARGVQTLQDGILSGTGQVVYQDRINEQFPTLKAAQLVAQDGDKFVDNYVATLASKNLTPKMSTILAPKSRNDLFDFNRIEQAYRHGWEIAKIEPNNLSSTFLLKADSKINARLAQEHFPDLEPGEITHLPDMSVTAKKAGYSPLQVSSVSADLSQAISDMSIQSGHENNSLRLALGKPAIQLRDFHLPTPELNKDGTWFVRNPVGRVIATYTGPNFAQNQQRAQKAATELGDFHVAVPLETIKADHQINDDNFFSIIDYSDQLAKTGQGISGGLAHTEIDTTPFTLKAMVKSLQEQYLNTGIRARAAIFEPELNYARQAADAASAATRDNLGAINIFDRYISTIFSQSPNTGKGAIGKVYGGIESSLDRSLSWLNAHYTELTGSESNQAGARVMRGLLRKQSSAEEFAQFQKTLPDWSPFKDTQAWAESTFAEKPSPTIRQYSAQLSKISSTLSLRFLDVGTAINNFAGLVTNTPSLMYALRQAPGEAHADWLNRTAAWGSQIKPGTVTFSPMKAMNTAIHALWSGELNEPMGLAAKQGYFDPEYASLTKALSTPMKPSSKAMETFITRASSLADKSETISRQISWGMGYKIGKDLHGFTDEKDAYIFANNFVNDMIGNYSPNNKPAMFQGAVGLPLGAFQTYMSNFYRRLYGMAERGDKAALLAQYAAQASVFGAKSVPGFNAWNSVFQTNNTTGDDFTGRLRRTLDPGVSELLLNGSLSNIPKIWGGLQGDGLAFYSRGSVDYTQPPATLLDMSKAPPMQFLADVAKGISASADNFFSGAGFSLQQEEEILARFSTNRAFKSIMEQASDVKTDQRGNVIQMGTHDALTIAAGIFGTQPSSVQSAKEANARERIVRLSQEDLMTSLDDHTKAIFRSGNITVEDLQGTVHDYLKAGGNPQYLGQWFRNSFLQANTPAIQKQLETLGKSGKLLQFQDMLVTLQQNQNPNQKKGN